MNFKFLQVGKHGQFLRFLVIGLVNTTFSYGVYAILIFVGLYYAIANLAALLLGLLFSFKMQGRFVFGNSDNRLFWKFLFAWSLIYFATIALIGELISVGFNAYIAGALALPFTTVLSYLMQKFFVFRSA